MNRLTVSVLLAVAIVGMACDEAQVREATGSQSIVFDDSGMRMLITPDGLAAVYERARADGFSVSTTRRELWREEGIVIEAGPVSQNVDPSAFLATSGDGSVDWETRFEEVEIVVPVRVTRGADVRICRKALQTANASVNATAVLADGAGGPAFEVPMAPVLDDEGFSIRDVGACDQGELPVAFDLESSLTTYVRDAFVVSTVDALETSPFDTLGVVLDRLEIRRASAFESGRGTIVVEGRLPEAAADLSTMGLTAAIDTAIDVERAGCAPPVELPAPIGPGARQIDPSELPADADVAFSVSESVLNRTVQVVALSGLACRGFEDARIADENDDIITTDDLLLDEIGLGDLPLGDSSRVVFRPGSLPELSMRPERGDLLLDWNDMTVEVYSDMFGVPTRIAQVDTSAQATLSPGAGSPGMVSFTVSTIDVIAAELTSDLAAPVNDSVVEAWTRRTLLLALADLVSFPLPLAPGNGVTVLQTQVRSGDLLIVGGL